MVTLKVAISSIFCFILHVNATIKTTLDSYSYPDSQFLVHSRSFDKTTLTFTLCRVTEVKEKKCTIFWENDSENRQTHNMTFKAEDRYGTILDGPYTIPFGKNKVIIFYLERTSDHIPKYKRTNSSENDYDTFLKFGVLKLDNSEITETKIPVNKHDFSRLNIADQLYFLIYESSYAVVFKNKQLCGEKYCRLIIDENSKIISEPTCWFSAAQLYNLIPNTDSQSTDYLIVNHLHHEDLEFLELSLIGNSDPKLVRKLSLDQDSERSVGYSMEHNIISICYGKYSNFNCTFVDIGGNTKLQAPVSTSYNSMYASPYYLKNGGFLVLIYECRESDPMCRKEGPYRYHVKKFDDSGKEVGDILLDTTEFACDYREKVLTTQLFEDDLKEYCASFRCFDENVLYDENKKSPNLISMTKCFTDEDL